MTDERMAERYVNGIPIFTEEGEGFSRTQMQQAYLAGLKAGRGMNVATKWHDLRKDPNDLPVGHRVVINQVGMATTYDPNRGFLGFGGAGIIAWCEIPIFTDKENE